MWTANYVRQNPVLLAPGEAGHTKVSGRGRWAGPWQPPRPLNRVCPACVTGPEPRRLLRSLVDEVSLALTGRSAHGRATLEQIWHTTGRPVRAGLTTWRPYEHLDPGAQDAMRHAAATALMHTVK